MSRKRDRWDSSSSEEEEVEVEDQKGEDQDPLKKQARPIRSSLTANDHNLPTGEIGTGKNHGLGLGSNSPSNAIKRLSVSKLHVPLLNGCRMVYDSYERIDRIDEGTYGIVWKARDLKTNQVVALKQIKFEPSLRKEGFPMAALREIGVLLALSHESIVTVKEMVVGDNFDKVYMAMELMEMDLQQAMKQSESSPFPQAEVKSMMHQILSATQHIHEKWILHRDLKTSNILVHQSGKICLCDFGLARKYQFPLKAMTLTVITLWYRPIELLFGKNVYGPEVDMWSIGCIFGELLKKAAMMQGQGELDQIDKIFKMIGSPNEDTWPDFHTLPNTSILRWKNKNPPKIYETFPVNSFVGGQTYLDSNGFDLLQRLLTLDPQTRLSAEEALKHAYFFEGVEMKIPRFFTV
mmetsp:Transcript_4936/g.9415  ORF Transcript_4936/g.9415 Transcript_4936/m.9415 type:complete len:407 (-) Transcript_4936:3211-4431(-)